MHGRMCGHTCAILGKTDEYDFAQREVADYGKACTKHPNRSPMLVAGNCIPKVEVGGPECTQKTAKSTNTFT